MTTVHQILQINNEDDQFEAMAELQEDLMDEPPKQLTEADLQDSLSYLKNPQFPDNLGMMWTVVIAATPYKPICEFAHTCIVDQDSPCRDLAAQYLRLHCEEEFKQCLDQILADDEADVRFEGLDHLCETEPDVCIRQMIAIVHDLSRNNVEFVRQHLVEDGQKHHVVDLRERARDSKTPYVYEDLLQTMKTIRPDVVASS